MKKHTVLLLLTAGLCLLALQPARSTGWEEAVPAAQTDYDPRDEPADPRAEQRRRIEALLDGYRLTGEQRQALLERMEADGGLLARLEAGELTGAELDWLALPNGREDRLERYAAWSEEHLELSPADTALQVNMNRDREFYSAVQTAEDPDSVTVLVNKHYQLPDGFVPELEVLGAGYGSGSMQPEAAAAFRAMADAARAEGVSLRSVSAYRSYQLQKSAYNGYLRNASQAYVDTFSARPGHSEHQTGLAVDINVATRKANFEKTPAFAWLKEHCAEYGFILRYLEDKQAITGYRFEPWHFRYVGEEAARVCMDQVLAYEEYIALLPS